ncbi:hypothetical protein [Nocardioides jiangxiensis]|uniref:DUF4244 domain-containing protein n=1 Tax=Nocardioides jiangxiensis TaxID=3064524 RepID=A0ABT9B281_9ACTN|nr:hypothetical protein [Nocardioides sp. WY-20]MDO7868962.1 hypothetical protein [Nocardioides sp. WY-20]
MRWWAWCLVLTSTTAPRRRDERGDVPGWVLVTIMTAGLVTMLWRFAGPQLQQMLSNALAQVSG